jgi:hypothetical protein
VPQKCCICHTVCGGGSGMVLPFSAYKLHILLLRACSAIACCRFKSRAGSWQGFAYCTISLAGRGIRNLRGCEADSYLRSRGVLCMQHNAFCSCDVNAAGLLQYDSRQRASAFFVQRCAALLGVSSMLCTLAD